MKRRVCCFLLGLCILCLPAQQVFAAPAGPAAQEEEKKEEKKKPHEKKHERKKHPKPHEKEKQEAEENQPTDTAVTTPTVAPISTLGSEVVKYALQHVGNPYKYGGTSLTNGADCSGFVQSVYAHFGYSISRTSREQAKNAGYMEVDLKESELQPGDLIFYANNSGVVFHVAMYIGDGKVVHAANAKSGIIVSEYNYMKAYKARRVIG